MMEKLMIEKSTLEYYFQPFREAVIGYNKTIHTPYGKKKLVYADWVASGRLYQPIEDKLTKEFGPLIGNTHTETNITGTTMTIAYEEAKRIIKKHVNADFEQDILLLYGSGMTGAINKLIRILGWRVHEKYHQEVAANIPENERPIVFTSIMEHHSNDITWRESIADVEYIPYNTCTLLPDMEAFDEMLKKYENRKYKVAAVCACSNVTGIESDYYQIAKLMHQHNGYCFVDFAASAPYVNIDIHPTDEPDAYLDAIYFSPHKFVGGPGTSGVLLFNKDLYSNSVPDAPGGGTVKWVNRWGEQSYWDKQSVHGIEAREDGGTPPFLQTIKTALCILLKEKMGVDNILAREHELLQIALPILNKMPNITVLKGDIEDRIGIISFYLNGNSVAYNLLVKLLNDHYGIQMRGGCACAGPYGHCLLEIDQIHSKSITDQIERGDNSQKPGWVRLSLHPLMTNEELYFILNAIDEVCNKFEELKADYEAVPNSTEWLHKDDKRKEHIDFVHGLFGI